MLGRAILRTDLATIMQHLNSLERKPPTAHFRPPSRATITRTIHDTGLKEPHTRPGLACREHKAMLENFSGFFDALDAVVRENHLHGCDMYVLARWLQLPLCHKVTEMQLQCR